MKRIIFIAGVLVFLAGCGKATADENNEVTNEVISEAFSSENIALQEVDNLQDAQITLPVGIIGDELTGKNVIEKEDESNDSTSNEISSDVTYSISGSERIEIVNEVADEVLSTIDEILENDELYPTIVKIVPSEDCTEFDFYFSTNEISFYEGMLPLTFFILGDKYQLYYGIPSDNVLTTIKYIDMSDNNIFYTSTSAEVDTQ